MQFHLIKSIKEIVNIMIYVFVGIVLASIFLQIKFKADEINQIYGYIIAIVFVVMIYIIFKKSINKRMIVTNHVKTKKLSLNWKLLIFGCSYILENGLSVLIGNNNKSENQKLLEKLDKHNDVSIVLIKTGLSAPIIEEIIFRGMLFLIILTASSFLAKRSRVKFDYLGIIGFFIFSSLLFGYAHVAKAYDIQNIGDYIASGLTLSLVFILTRNIKLCIFIHMYGNIVNVLFRYNYEGIAISLNFLVIVLTMGLLIISSIPKFQMYKDLNNFIEYQEYKFKKWKCLKKLKNKYPL